MYQPVANSIKEKLNQGFAVLPTEGYITKFNKILANQFFALDYRVSNPMLLSTDAQSNINGEVQASNDVSSYIMGFALVKNIDNIPELSTSKKSTITRFKNKMLETVALSISHSSLRRNRGTRATYVDRNFITPNTDVLKDVGISYAKIDDWILIPFVTSTTIFYNNFRANIGIGEKKHDLENIQNDVQTRLSSNLDSIRDKLNQRLSTTISDSLYGKLFLVSPKSLMDEKYTNDIFDYVDVKNYSSKSLVLVDTPNDDWIIPIPKILI